MRTALAIVGYVMLFFVLLIISEIVVVANYGEQSSTTSGPATAALSISGIITLGIWWIRRWLRRRREAADFKNLPE